MRRLLFAVAAALALTGCETCDTGSAAFTFASWNIGHFALGRDCKSHVRAADAAARAKAYNDFLDEVGADVFGVAEYSENFVCDGDVSAKSAVFGHYGQTTVGPQHGYQWNAQFWNGYKCLSANTVSYPQHDQGVYYVASRLKVAGKEVVFVSTHLDWTTFKPGHENDRKSQMQKLIDDFRDEPHVVIAGDFNVGIRSPGKKSLDNPIEYKVFADAGYTLGNDGRHKTCPAGRLDPENGRSLDNIIVKGLELEDFRVFDRPDLSDHALVRARLRVR